ncbi:MAG: lmo0937 family membrane protein [Bacteroidetes bacterium]|nr:MAG: lmo0937 family membrane protein [Bacteroidota bacterium]
MNNILYTIAVILVVLWAIGFLGYHSGGILHLLLVLAAMAILIRIIRGDKIV